LCEDSVAYFRQTGDPRGLACELAVLGRVAALQVDDQAALSAYGECLRLRNALVSVDLAFIAAEYADLVMRTAVVVDCSPAVPEAAVRLMGAVAGLRETVAEEKLQVRKFDVVQTEHSKISGRLEATVLALLPICITVDSAVCSNQRVKSSLSGGECR
jgi:hypothetical protein